MGARRVGLILVAVYCVHAQTPVWTSDPAGDAKPGGPDIVAVQALVSNGVMTLRARFAPATFNAGTTRVAWVLDTDQDAATGSPGLFGSPGVSASGIFSPVDETQIGADAVALAVGACDVGSLTRYDRQTTKWVLAEQLATVVLPDGFEAYADLDSLGKKDAKIRFKAVSYRFSGECPPRSLSFDVADIAPDVGQPAALTQEADSALAAPQLLSPPTGTVLSLAPRTTILRWNPLAGSAGYLVEVQYEDPSTAAGWAPFRFERVTDTAITFDFVGAQQGRWRVWAIDRDGLASAPSKWSTFRHTR